MDALSEAMIRLSEAIIALKEDLDEFEVAHQQFLKEKNKAYGGEE